MKVADIANEIYIELESPSEPTLPYIISWLRYNIGEFNNLIGTCVAITSDLEFSPEITENQKAILKKMFYVDYYKGLITKSLSAAGYLGNTNKIGWISMREGDTQITRANPNEVAKTIRGLMQDSQKDLDGLVKLYKLNQDPLQVVGDDTVADTYYTSSSYNPRYRSS